MPRILIPIIACLVLVGCGKRWTAEDLEWLRQTEAMLDTITALVYEKCAPCPPCPDTVTFLVRIDSTTYYDGGAEHHWSYVSPDTVMPPGRWVVVDSLGYVQMTGWHTYGKYQFYYIGLRPDSAYILSGEE